MKILYIEDNINDIDLLQREFKKTHPQIILDTAMTINEAKEKISGKEEFDLALIDMKLPDGNGLDVLSHIRRNNIPLPVIILTGFGDEEAAVLSLKAGADDYVAKRDGYYSKVSDSIQRAIEHYEYSERFRASRIKVLYIEHNQEDIDLTLRHIARYAPNIVVECQRTGREALNILFGAEEQPGYDVVILDYRLQDMDAVEIIKVIFEKKGIKLPVIIVTGQGNEEIAAHVFRLGISDYIVKNSGYLFKLPMAVQSAYDKVQLINQYKELEQKNEELSNYFNNALDMLCISDLEGHFIRINKEWSRSLGYDIEEIYTKRIIDFVHEDDKEKTLQAISEMKKTNTILDLVTRYLGKDGVYRWLEWRSYRIEEIVYSVARDITRRINTEELLRESNEYVIKFLEYSNVPIIVWDIGMNVTYFNKAFERISGYTAQEVYKRGPAILVPEDLRQKILQLIMQASAGDCWSNIEMPIQGKDGSEKCLLWNSANITGKDNKTIVATFAQGMDITDRKIGEEKNKYLSIHDHLTGLFNRAYYEDITKKLDKLENLPLTVVFADVNGLKLINDAYGYEKGDQLLCVAADVIKNGFRQKDIVIRMGGDEFVIIMPNTSTKDAEKIVQKIRKMNQAIQIETIELSISFGIETKNKTTENLNDVLKNAENYMYRVKLFEGPSMRGKTIHAILNTLHEKNKREELHSHRVSKLCAIIGKELNMNENNINDLVTVGLLHDIGKVAVHESLLNKAEKLTADEWEELQRHPEIGYRILSAVNDMADLAEYVLYHHERWDGKGYPRGLKGNAIPLQSRIIAVVDSYDAMTSVRPYRDALTKEAAKEEIRINAGKQFDPEIADVFLKTILK